MASSRDRQRALARAKLDRQMARRAARERARERACATDSTYVRGVESRYNGQLRIGVRLPVSVLRGDRVLELGLVPAELD